MKELIHFLQKHLLGGGGFCIKPIILSLRIHAPYRLQRKAALPSKHWLAGNSLQCSQPESSTIPLTHTNVLVSPYTSSSVDSQTDSQ
jgi:hypothetical protein